MMATRSSQSVRSTRLCTTRRTSVPISSAPCTQGIASEPNGKQRVESKKRSLPTSSLASSETDLACPIVSRPMPDDVRLRTAIRNRQRDEGTVWSSAPSPTRRRNSQLSDPCLGIGNGHCSSDHPSTMTERDTQVLGRGEAEERVRRGFRRRPWSEAPEVAPASNRDNARDADHLHQDRRAKTKGKSKLSTEPARQRAAGARVCRHQAELVLKDVWTALSANYFQDPLVVRAIVSGLIQENNGQLFPVRRDGSGREVCGNDARPELCSRQAAHTFSSVERVDQSKCGPQQTGTDEMLPRVPSGRVFCGAWSESADVTPYFPTGRTCQQEQDVRCRASEENSRTMNPSTRNSPTSHKAREVSHRNRFVSKVAASIRSDIVHAAHTDKNFPTHHSTPTNEGGEDRCGGMPAGVSSGNSSDNSSRPPSRRRTAIVVPDSSPNQALWSRPLTGLESVRMEGADGEKAWNQQIGEATALVREEEKKLSGNSGVIRLEESSSSFMHVVTAPDSISPLHQEFFTCKFPGGNENVPTHVEPSEGCGNGTTVTPRTFERHGNCPNDHDLLETLFVLGGQKRRLMQSKSCPSADAAAAATATATASERPDEVSGRSSSIADALQVLEEVAIVPALRKVYESVRREVDGRAQERAKTAASIRTERAWRDFNRRFSSAGSAIPCRGENRDASSYGRCNIDSLKTMRSAAGNNVVARIADLSPPRSKRIRHTQHLDEANKTSCALPTSPAASPPTSTDESMLRPSYRAISQALRLCPDKQTMGATPEACVELKNREMAAITASSELVRSSPRDCVLESVGSSSHRRGQARHSRRSCAVLDLLGEDGRGTIHGEAWSAIDNAGVNNVEPGQTKRRDGCNRRDTFDQRVDHTHGSGRSDDRTTTSPISGDKRAICNVKQECLEAVESCHSDEMSARDMRVDQDAVSATAPSDSFRLNEVEGDDPVDETRHACQEPDCDGAAQFGTPGWEPVHCSAHRRDWEVLLKHAVCLGEGCERRPAYGFPGNFTRVYCKRHRFPGCVSLVAAGWKMHDKEEGLNPEGWVEVEEDGMGIPVDSDLEAEMDARDAALGVHIESSEEAPTRVDLETAKRILAPQTTPESSADLPSTGVSSEQQEETEEMALSSEDQGLIVNGAAFSSKGSEVEGGKVEVICDSSDGAYDSDEDNDEDFADDPMFAPGRFAFLIPSKKRPPPPRSRKNPRPILVGKIIPSSPPSPPPGSEESSSPQFPVSSAEALLLATVGLQMPVDEEPVPTPAVCDSGDKRWIHVHWHTPASLRRNDYCRGPFTPDFVRTEGGKNGGWEPFTTKIRKASVVVTCSGLLASRCIPADVLKELGV